MSGRLVYFSRSISYDHVGSSETCEKFDLSILSGASCGLPLRFGGSLDLLSFSHMYHLGIQPLGTGQFFLCSF